MPSLIGTILNKNNEEKEIGLGFTNLFVDIFPFEDKESIAQTFVESHPKICLIKLDKGALINRQSPIFSLVN